MTFPADLLKLIQDAQNHLIAPDEVRARFDQIASPAFGDNMSRWMPDYDYVHHLLVDALRAHAPGAAQVLDLGAGTGRLSRFVLDAVPGCHVTLVDFSELMLKQAPIHLAAHPGRFEMRRGDIFDPALTFAPGAFHAVVSVFAISHGRGGEAYQSLYHRIDQWLKPGGVFLCCDHVLGASTAFTLLNVAGWRAYMERELPRASANDGIRSTYDEDSPLPLHQHLDLLRDAGFESVDVLWKRDIFALYAGVKPALEQGRKEHG